MPETRFVICVFCAPFGGWRMLQLSSTQLSIFSNDPTIGSEEEVNAQFSRKRNSFFLSFISPSRLWRLKGKRLRYERKFIGTLSSPLSLLCMGLWLVGSFWGLWILDLGPRKAGRKAYLWETKRVGTFPLLRTWLAPRNRTVPYCSLYETVARFLFGT